VYKWILFLVGFDSIEILSVLRQEHDLAVLFILKIRGTKVSNIYILNM